MSKQKSLSELLPEYPRTSFLPWKPNTKGDRIADEREAAVIFGNPHVTVQEKVDGANCGMALVDGHPVIRNRTKILRKGNVSGKSSPGTAQFSAAFNWFYENIDKFEKLSELLGPVSVYGEWMVQQHGMVYDNLPDWFLPFDVFDHEIGQYLDMKRAYNALVEAGFHAIEIDEVQLTKYEQLEALANLPSKYATGQKREGVYVKVSNGKYTTDRFKMVREGFEQGCLLDDRIKKNKLSR